MSAKGGAWEREICKKLSKWINGEEKPYVFWRGSGSGGTFTRDNLVGDRFAGDIYNIREEGKFLVDRFVLEAKNGYPKASIDKFLKQNTTDEIKDFWIQATEQANHVNKYPMLIYKKKGMSISWLGIETEVFKKLYKYLIEERYIHLYWGKCDELPDLYLYDFDKFIECITPDIIKKIRKKKK